MCIRDRPLTAESDGYLGMLDALAIGKGCVLLGAGRRTLEDVIDPAVGVIVRKKLGNPVTTGDPILEIHYNLYILHTPDIKDILDILYIIKYCI